MDQDDLNKMFETLLKNLPDGVILCDRAGDIVYVNPAAEVIRDITKDERIGQNILNCHLEENRDKVARVMEHITKNPTSNFHRMVTDQNNHKLYQTAYMPLMDEQNTIQGFAVISRDVTKERELEEKRVQEARIREIAISNLQAQYQHTISSAMEMLSDVMEAKDVYTNGHTKRVTRYAMSFYEHLFGLDNGYYDIEFAAKLHDIGKVCIPEQILLKPGKLDEEEVFLIQQHPVISANLITKIDPGSRIAPFIRCHHERYDGMGYPDGLCGEEIPFGARMIALADSYDAMRSDRPYRKGLTIDESIKEIAENAGTQFDPRLAEEFCELIRTGCFD